MEKSITLPHRTAKRTDYVAQRIVEILIHYHCYQYQAFEYNIPLPVVIAKVRVRKDEVTVIASVL